MLPRAARAGVTVLLVLAIPAAVSLADIDQGSEGGVHYWADTSTGDPATIKVRCRAGTHAAGGGFGGGMNGAEPSVLVPMDAGDRDRLPDDGWRARLADGGGETVGAHLACTQRKLTYIRSVPKTLVAGGIAQGIARCPPGTHVIGGGAAAAADVEIDSSYPIDRDDPGGKPDDAWRVRVESRAAGESDFRVHAICQRPQPAYAAVTDELPVGTGSAVFTPCADSRHILAAGVRLSGPAGSGAIRGGLHPWDGGDPDLRPDDEAYAFGVNQLGASAPKTVTGFAVCD
jgi:hypothetical protein